MTRPLNRFDIGGRIIGDDKYYTKITGWLRKNWGKITDIEGGNGLRSNEISFFCNVIAYQKDPSKYSTRSYSDMVAEVDVSTISKDMGITPRAVQYISAKMQARGLLNVIKRKATKFYNAANLYDFSPLIKQCTIYEIVDRITKVNCDPNLEKVGVFFVDTMGEEIFTQIHQELFCIKTKVFIARQKLGLAKGEFLDVLLREYLNKNLGKELGEFMMAENYRIEDRFSGWGVAKKEPIVTPAPASASTSDTASKPKKTKNNGRAELIEWIEALRAKLSPNLEVFTGTSKQWVSPVYGQLMKAASEWRKVFHPDGLCISTSNGQLVFTNNPAIIFQDFANWYNNVQGWKFFDRLSPSKTVSHLPLYLNYVIGRKQAFETQANSYLKVASTMAASVVQKPESLPFSQNRPALGNYATTVKRPNMFLESDEYIEYSDTPNPITGKFTVTRYIWDDRTFKTHISYFDLSPYHLEILLSSGTMEKVFEAMSQQE